MQERSGLTVDVAPAWDRPLVTVPAFALLSLVGGLFSSFSVAANVYVVLIGGAATWLGLSARMPKRAAPWRPGRAAAWWLLPAALFAGLELSDFLLGSTYAHPTLSMLADPALAHYSIRSFAYFAWLGGFWGLVRR